MTLDTENDEIETPTTCAYRIRFFPDSERSSNSYSEVNSLFSDPSKYSAVLPTAIGQFLLTAIKIFAYFAFSDNHCAQNICISNRFFTIFGAKSAEFLPTVIEHYAYYHFIRTTIEHYMPKKNYAQFLRSDHKT